MNYYCPTCNQNLRRSDFGIDRSRESGRNLYCKACCRAKSRAQRERLGVVPRKVRNSREKPEYRFGATERTMFQVREAIAFGNRTRDAIEKFTGLNEELISDCLAKLLFVQGELKSKRVGEDREFYLNTRAA